MSVRILAGDIGGTNARLVLYEADTSLNFDDYKSLKQHRIITQRNYKNNDFLSFSDVLCAFLALPGNADAPIQTCCFAVAGPVQNNRINFTNRDGWIIDRNTIETDFQIPRVQLVNDFVASGYGLLSLSDEELITLQEGKKRDNAPVALVGAGTGLGECYLARAPGANHATAYPSEGGHVEFAPRSIIEEELLRFLQKRYDSEASGSSLTDAENGTAQLSIGDALMTERSRVSVERVLSGGGLENIYEFLRDRYPEQVDTSFDEQYYESTERGRLIGKQQYSYGLFRKALEIMFGIYGSEVGNVALKYLPYGGLYIAGGIAPKNAEFITGPDSLFMERFRQKGRLSSIMPDFPVYVVMKEDLGLRGAHIVASRLAKDVVQPEERVEKDEPAYANGVANGIPPSAITPVKSDMLRNAIADYPMSYAFVTSVTAVATATAMAISAIVFAKNR